MGAFENMGIDYKEKAFYDILIPVEEQFAFEYPDDKTFELAKAIKAIVDDKTKYTDWSDREDIKAELKMDIHRLQWKLFIKTCWNKPRIL